MLEAPVLRLLELALLAMVICIFIGRLVMVSAYQRRTGDYFDILLMAWYPSPQTGQALEKRRFRTIAYANLLVKIMWLCGSLLAVLCVVERQFFN